MIIYIVLLKVKETYPVDYPPWTHTQLVNNLIIIYSGSYFFQILGRFPRELFFGAGGLDMNYRGFRIGRFDCTVFYFEQTCLYFLRII